MSPFDSTIDLSRTRDRDQRTDGFLDNYVGHRAKIGVIIPSTNISVEYDCQQIIPRGVVWNFARFFIEHPNLSDDKNFVQFLELLRGTVPDAVRDVLTCKPDHMMMGMSAETFWGGVEGNDGFVDHIQQLCGDIGLTTGANAVISAIEAYQSVGHGIKNIAVLGPYQPIGDKNVRKFFEESGFNVKHVAGLKADNATDAIALTPEFGGQGVMDVVKQIDGDDVDAIIQVGTNLSTANIFPTLEKWLEKPAISINTACCWHALRACGVNDQLDGKGRLFEEF
ncbi:Asp/Glu racemase [Oceanicoccus sagamiensis]|uniref:maleate cis-trans isomerase family protein n=1 Tax=Oceanicoccus sagamiensis TaxID=716816 RepID=UPI000A26E2B4|nr:Asp/Glu racemase [Oceanicoccus sagamiensis]